MVVWRRRESPGVGAENRLKSTVLRKQGPLVQVFRGLPPVSDTPIALTIGNFDGVHRGHRAMLSRLVEAADDLALPASVLTFDPPPREYFARASAPPRLSLLRDKVEQFSARGVARTYVARFDAEARFARGGSLHRRRARAPAGRTLAAGGGGLPLRQGPCGRPSTLPPLGADIQRRSDAHGASGWGAHVVDGRARGARGRRSRARRRAARTSVHDLGPRRARVEARTPMGISDGEPAAEAHASRSPASSRCASTASRPLPGTAWRASACARR